MATFTLSALAIRLIGSAPETPSKCFSSGRPCPMCSQNLHYRAPFHLAAADRYIGACAACGYRDRHKVQLIRSCEGPMIVRRT